MRWSVARRSSRRSGTRPRCLTLTGRQQVGGWLWDLMAFALWPLLASREGARLFNLPVSFDGKRRYPIPCWQRWADKLPIGMHEKFLRYCILSRATGDASTVCILASRVPGCASYRSRSRSRRFLVSIHKRNALPGSKRQMTGAGAAASSKTRDRFLGSVLLGRVQMIDSHLV